MYKYKEYMKSDLYIIFDLYKIYKIEYICMDKCIIYMYFI